MTERETQPTLSVPARACPTRPLLRPFPLAVMALATFLVVFTLMMARLSASTHLPISSLAGVGTPVTLKGGSPAGAVSTRASGAGAAAVPVTSQAVAEGATPATSTIVTRTSGATGAGAVRDE